MVVAAGIGDRGWGLQRCFRTYARRTSQLQQSAATNQKNEQDSVRFGSVLPRVYMIDFVVAPRSLHIPGVVVSS